MPDELSTQPVGPEVTQTSLPEDITPVVETSDTNEYRAFAPQLRTTFHALLQVIGESLDLSDLDGVTVADDYASALLNLDRGMDGLSPLTPSDSEIIGVAMAPSVIREGRIKTHLVFDVKHLWPLLLPDHALCASTIHLVAHECAHVEVTSAFERAYPGYRMSRQLLDPLSIFRTQAMFACWDEYGASRLSANWGEHPLNEYVSSFVNFLSTSDVKANRFVIEYRYHGDIQRVLAEVGDVYQTLLKLASYTLGTMHGIEKSLDELPELSDALKGSWFEDLWNRLERGFVAAWDEFGGDDDLSLFNPISDVAVDALKHGGLILQKKDSQSASVDIPLRPNNTPPPSIRDLLGPYG